MQKFIDQYFSLIRRVLPKQPEESCVGLDIGTRSCKVVELVLSSSAPKVKNWGIEPIDNNNASEAIKKLFLKVNIQTSQVYTALSGQGTLIRFIKMPRMSINQLKDSLLLEADKYFPFSKDQIYLDCHILGNPKESKMDVLVAVAKKDLIEQRLDLLESLGLQQNFVGINAVALATAFSRLKQAPDDTQDHEAKISQKGIALIDIGELKTSLIVLTGGNPRFTRDISFGAKEFTHKISSAMGLEFKEAEHLKKDPKEKFADIQLACQPVFSGLAAEIRLSFDYFRSESHQDVHEIYLMGGSANIPGLDDFMTKELGLKARPWQPLEAFDPEGHVLNKDFGARIGEMGVAIGLSLGVYDED